MAKLLWGILCRRILVDKETNSISYLDAVEILGLSQFPAPMPVLYLGLMWKRSGEEDKEQIQLRARLVLPDGTEEDPFEFGTLVLDDLYYRVNVGIGGVKLAQEGDLQIIVEIATDGSWEVAYHLSVPVLLTDDKELQDDTEPT